MSSVINKSIKGNSLNSIFTEVKHNETLGLVNPEQLRLFHLAVSSNLFTYTNLNDFLVGTISEYVFSRAQVEKLSKTTNPHSIGIQALRIMKKNGPADTKGTGNELGEILLYAFMEDILGAPKLFSKVELNASSSSFGKYSDAIHLLELPGSPIPCYQTVFGSSEINGDIRSAIDNAFATIERIENDTNNTSATLVDNRIFEESFDTNTAKRIIDIMLPQGNSPVINDTAYGVLLGYSLGLNPNGRSNIDFRKAMDAKMQTDIKQHTSYITSKINNLNLNTHSFYFYIVPLNDAENDKRKIMEDLLI